MPQAHAQISWGDAADIAAGQPIRASGLIDMRNQIDALQAQIDAGNLGSWLSGAGNDIYYNAGDVGISESAPADRLEVRGNIRATGTNPRLRLEETDGTANQNMQISLVNGDLRVQRNNDAFSSATSLFTVDQQGNVGIGTTNPSAMLTVGPEDTDYGARNIRVNGGGAGNPSGGELRWLWLQTMIRHMIFGELTLVRTTFVSGEKVLVMTL